VSNQQAFKQVPQRALVEGKGSQEVVPAPSQGVTWAAAQCSCGPR